jgi:ApbE superfamily uncharacterized protein (UPF0280 family)
VREYIAFTWKEANLRICSQRADLVIERVKLLRAELDGYIERHPAFKSAFSPIPLLSEAPEIAVRMARAAEPCGVGPMAAVAGAVAQMAAEAAAAAGAREAIVENGGDIYLICRETVFVGLFAGDHPLSGRLALRFEPGRTPVSVCSSSSRFGHSMSLGDCDLATIVSTDGALADAAATLAGNSVKSPEDVEPTLEKVSAIPGIQGVILIKEDRMGVAGDLPPLVRCEDPNFQGKTFHLPR